MHFFKRHIFIRRVFNSSYRFPVNHIAAHLPQKNAMCANIRFGAVLLNAFSNKSCGGTGPVAKYVFWFFFCHVFYYCRILSKALMPPFKL